MTSQATEVSEAMVKTFHSNVEMLLERMQKVSGQGKHIAMDATVQVRFSFPLMYVCLCVLCGTFRDGAVASALASHQHGPGSNPGPGVICGFLSCSEGFSPSSSVFLPGQKPALTNSNSISTAL